MVETILAVPYHEQSEFPKCGAACLRMVLGTIPGSNTAGEATLFAEITSAAWGGGGSPDQVADTLKARGGQRASTVVVAKQTGLHAEAELIRRMIWSIHDVGVPPIALVAWDEESRTGDGHWVVVAGYQADRHPTGPADTECAVSGLEFSNPVMAAGDQTYPNHVSIGWWRSRYMKPVGDIEDYKGSVVAVAGGTLGSA